MAVYDTGYKRYLGPMTDPKWRFLIPVRYAYERLAKSKLLLLLVLLSTFFTVGSAVLIYLRHNAQALAVLSIEVADMFPIDGRFFSIYLSMQLFLGFLLVLLIGPALISMDLANGAFPLYLSRPFSRWQYLAGKFSVLAIVLSIVTWIPGLLLFALQSYLEGPAWFGDNLRIGAAIFGASWLWICVYSLLTLALSAWVRWPLAVRGAILMIVIVFGAFGAAFNAVLNTKWGSLLSISQVLERLQAWMFGISSIVPLPVWAAWMGILLLVLGCFGLLVRKLRAFEVVK